MLGQSWVKNFLHFLVLRKKVSNFAAAPIMLFHANGQSLDPAQKQPAFERRQNRSGALLNERKLFRLLRFGADNNASQTVAVPVEKFCGRVNNHVGAKFDRTLEIRRHESVVNNHFHPMPMAEFSRGSKVAKFHQRIRWRLHE